MSEASAILGAVDPLSVTLDDLKDPELLRALLAAAESDHVERKRELDRDKLAKTISGFANADGGWLLLGVEDDGTIGDGYSGKGRAHVRDWLRDRLDTRLDPMPTFAAETFAVDGQTIAVVFVPRSTRAPHFMDKTGEVYERRNGQTRRASSARVRELYGRGGEAARQALTRLDDSAAAPLIAARLDAPRTTKSMHAQHLAVIVRLALEEPPATYRQFVDDPAALERTEAFVEQVVPTLNDRGGGIVHWKDRPYVRRSLTGHDAFATWEGIHLGEVAVAFDEAGVAGYRVAGNKRDPSFTLIEGDMRGRWLVPGLSFLVRSLHGARVLGLAHVRLDLYGTRGCWVSPEGQASSYLPDELNNTLEINLTVDLAATTGEELAAKLWSQVARAAGIIDRPAQMTVPA
jgi:hypothetical protein